MSREYDVLSKLKDCENVVKMHDIFYSETEEEKKVQNLIFEFCSSNLEEVIQKFKSPAVKRYIPMPTVRNFMKHILTGMNYVHSLSICHRDLKPENLLLFGVDAEGCLAKDGQGIVKVCDFGSAKVLEKNHKSKEPQLNTPYIVSR